MQKEINERNEADTIAFSWAIDSNVDHHRHILPLGCNVNTNLASNYVTIYRQNTQIPLLTVRSLNTKALELGLKRYNLIGYTL